MAQAPKKTFRKLDGILLLDKPQGLSSNQALQRVRHLFRAEKAGHTGSLDPLATGLLPVCFGEATKIAGNLLGSRKAYDTVARLGIVTDTDDAEGQPLRERPVDRYDIATIDAALRGLTGRIQQVPPIFSALKRGGEPLYAKARRGEVIELESRPIDVHAFELLSEQDLLDGDAPQLRLHVECGSGTYVRSLVRDLGEALGCGAHVAELRRLWVDPSAIRACGPSTRCRRWPNAIRTARCLPAADRGRPGRISPHRTDRRGRGPLPAGAAHPPQSRCAAGVPRTVRGVRPRRPRARTGRDRRHRLPASAARLPAPTLT